MKSHKIIGLVFAALFLLQIGVNAQGKLKWYSFKEGYEKAVKENKFLLVDFYTDWCKWCKVMDEKTYSQKSIIEDLNKNFVAVKLNPEKGGNVSYQGETFSSADFAKAAQVSGYPATGFFTRKGDFIHTMIGYQDVDKFTNILKYITNEYYQKFGFEDYQLFKSLEDRYKVDPKNADLNFVLGFFYEKIFQDNTKAKKHYLASIEKSPKYSEVYSSLYLMAKKDNNKSESDKWLKKAKSNTLKTEEQIVEKVKQVIGLYM